MKFAVMKNYDIQRYLTDEKRSELHGAFEEIAINRHAEGKKPNRYIVINTDEPYADEVIEMMKRHGHWG
ncbi:hypothetical protein GK047_07900 [Paenibacillus sp. SYP-B3998]|uniref:Uncharacterized protein n=2 Tax=Paenibacillus sp. SYP-B3998 TaxID=2678564 RepID=A0A6G3ZWI2_9BACL|nr:hypothetical protein [Paenibacillus sp. SYP-B3998]